jgi:hypothetical protein
MTTMGRSPPGPPQICFYSHFPKGKMRMTTMGRSPTGPPQICFYSHFPKGKMRMTTMGPLPLWTPAGLVSIRTGLLCGTGASWRKLVAVVLIPIGARHRSRVVHLQVETISLVICSHRLKRGNDTDFGYSFLSRLCLSIAPRHSYKTL